MASSDPSSVSFSRSSSIGSDGWEFVDWARRSSKDLIFRELHFDENVVLEMDYFDCPACSPRPPTRPAAGDNPPCTCRGDRAANHRPMTLEHQNSVMFMESDQENRFVSMISPRTYGRSESLKENNFYNLSLNSPRTPRTPKTPPEQIVKKLSRSASRRPPKSPSSKWLAVPDELETIDENMNASLSESMIYPKNRTDLGIIDLEIELESEVGEDTFPGFPPSIEAAMKSDFEPNQMMDTANYIGFGVLSPRPVIIQGLSPVRTARDEEAAAAEDEMGEKIKHMAPPEEAAADDEMGEKIKQETPPEEAAAAAAEDHVDDRKKNVGNERGKNKLGGIGALASIGVAAAATVAVLVLGGGNHTCAGSSNIGTSGSSQRKRRF